MSEVGPEGQGITRRELVTGAGIFVGGLMSGNLLIGDSSVRLTDESTHPPYETGDVIETAFGSVEIEGWRVLIPQELLDSADSSGTTVSFQLIDESKEKELSSNGSGRFVGSIERDGKFINVLPINPRTDGQPASLVLTAMDDINGRMSGTVFAIKPTVYTEVGAEFGQEQADFGSIMAEEPIGTENFKKLDKIRNLFKEFIVPSPVYLYKGVEEKKSDGTISGGGNSYSQGWIEMYTQAFTAPAYEDEGLGTAFHEWSHDIIKDLLDSRSSEGQQLIFRLNKAYSLVVETYYEDYPGDGKLSATDVLTESTYIKISGEKMGASQAGHPWDNFNEMFASTLTVMHFHHRGFLEQFRKLDTEEQKKIAAFVRATFDTLSAFNDSETALKSLLPAADEIKEIILADEIK